MTKQDFLAMSLPYGLKILKSDGQIAKIKGIDTNDNSSIYFYWNANYIRESIFDIDFKPILHSPADLTKEIEHNGEMFVPIIILGWSENIIGWSKKNINLAIENMRFDDAIKLIEWHFDIAGLIEKGEAIDVNTLDTTPYK